MHTEVPESDSDAPSLHFVPECSQLRSNAIFRVSVKVTYEAKATAKPIVFHKYVFEDASNFEIQRYQNHDWTVWDNPEKGGCGFMIVDDPDVSINVGQDDKFTGLRSGEFWTTS